MITSCTRRRRRLGGRRLVVGAVLVLGAAIAACGPVEAPPPPGAPTAPPDAITATILDRTNADRAANGLGPVVWNARLASLAGEWARYMTDIRELRHRNLSAALNSPGFESYAALGENILVGPASIDGHAMHNAWMASPSHYRIIMGNWDTVGIALFYGPDGNVRAVANYGRHL